MTESGVEPEDASLAPGIDAGGLSPDAARAEDGTDASLIDGFDASVSDSLPDGTDASLTDGFDASVADSSSDAADPPPPRCEDGTCDAAETCTSCASDCGVCSPTTPSAPFTVDATVGLVGRVSVAWSSVSGAQTYQAYRCTGTTAGTCTSITLWQAATTTNDTGATPGTTYYYRAKARSCASGVCTESAFSVDHRGSMASAPGAPVTLTASNGHEDLVVVAWSRVSGAEAYQVYRCTGSATSTCSSITSWQTDTHTRDTSMTSEVTYYYRVRARVCDSSFCTPSEYSAYDTGLAH